MKSRYSYILLFLIFFMASCSIEDTSVPGVNQAGVVFELTEADDDNISEIDILAFKVDANDNTKEYFSYRVQGTDISDNGATNKKKFTVSLLKGSGHKYRFVVLANARKDLDAIGEINTSGLKPEVLKRLISNHTGKWITNKLDEGYKDIPMWGETGQIIVEDNTNTITGVFLIRMLARVDVAVDAAAQSTFKLKSIRVYNYNTYGHITPNTDPAYWDGNQALKPTLPTDPKKQLGPIIYDQMTTPDIEISKGIYVYEATTVGDNAGSKATCIVIGGEYNNEGRETFYRYNFVKTSGEPTPLDLIRNNLYNVRITQVQASGYDTPQKAFDSQSINITANITVWSQGGLSDVIFDGQYILGVSKSEFTLPKDVRTVDNIDNKLVVDTDYPDGWAVAGIVDADTNPVSWLSATPTTGAPNAKTTMSLLLSENNSGSDRNAFVRIKAGRMQYVVKVKQTSIPDINLSTTNDQGKPITELLFLSQVGSVVPAQQFTVSWIPKTANNQVGVSSIGTHAFDFSGGGNIIDSGILSDPSGTKTYTIQPPAMTAAEIAADPFLEKISRIDYTVSNGVGYESKSLFVHQINYNAVPTVDVNYAMDGSTQYFTIKANASWRIEVTNDPLNIIDQIVTPTGGQYGDKGDEKAYFKTVNYTSNPLIFTGDVTFTIKSTNPARPFPDKTVTIKCYSGQIQVPSNTYLVPASNSLARSYLIPVSQANLAIPGSIGVDDKLEAYFVWTDEINHVTSVGLEAVGRGNTGYIYVNAGTPQGNTVVAARVGGVIKWSWHIWTTNYDPYLSIRSFNGYQLMDRNLGAISSAIGNYYSTGTFYQWGRKDPFPPSAGISSTVNEKIYNKGGQIASIPTSTSATLLSSAQNPLAYIIAPSTWNGSNGASSWNNGGQKTPFDPCPPGWKVPPTNTMWTPMNTTNFVWNGTSLGRNHATAGWFPASGVRNRTTGALGSVGSVGGYFSATYGTPYIPTFDFKPTTMGPSVSYYYIDGATIRCVRE